VLGWEMVNVSEIVLPSLLAVKTNEKKKGRGGGERAEVSFTQKTVKGGGARNCDLSRVVEELKCMYEEPKISGGRVINRGG